MKFDMNSILIHEKIDLSGLSALLNSLNFQQELRVLEATLNSQKIATLFCSMSKYGLLLNLVEDEKIPEDDMDYVWATVLRSFESFLHFSEFEDDLKIFVPLQARFANYRFWKTLNFIKDSNGYFKMISKENFTVLGNLKKALYSKVSRYPWVGKGLLVDADLFSQQSLEMLAQEYNAVAWGVLGWAIHSEVASDELSVIHKYVSGDSAVEVGAGSGRVTKALLGQVKQLVATDCSAAVIDSLNTQEDWSAQGVRLLVDDITQTQLPSATFDLVMFWENGLGNLLHYNQRQKAVTAMLDLCRPGGRVILAVRTFGDVSIAHLMPSRKYQRVMGIYHTFSPKEVVELLGDRVEIEYLIYGEDRPTGGKQLFVVARRKL
jgi:ubiquinone/menaquinone biosynthesis C-methylase UbiE